MANGRSPDATNRATHDAGHNSRPVEEVLADFRAKRAALVARLEAYAPADFGRTANHPRLGTPMRVVDMMVFHAEHDDYHLTRMREVAGTLRVP